VHMPAGTDHLVCPQDQRG